MLTRRVLLSHIFCAAATPVLGNVDLSSRPRPRPGPPEPLAVIPETERLIAAAGLTGQVAVRLVDARDGRPLLERAADEPLPPASVAKAVTTAYALDHLGPGHRFRTRLISTGPLRDGRLEGDLVLAGDGAPTLTADALAEMAQDAAEIGLKEITGRFLWWDGALPQIEEIDPSQPDHLRYNPSVSGLNLNFNQVHFQWRRVGEAYTTTMDARTDSRVPPVDTIRAQLIERARPIYSHGTDPDTGHEVWSVARPALGTGGARWLPVRNSGAFAADVFRTLARARGIHLPEAEETGLPPQGIALASLVSAPLADIATGMLRHSTNLTAEILGLAATRARLGGVPTDLTSSGAEMSAWAAESLGMANSAFVDHSGLSGDSRTTVSDLCNTLLALGPEGPLRPLLRHYGFADEMGRSLPMRASAKTGTLNFVSCLAGYIEPEDTPPLVFAIQTADLDRRAAIPAGQEDNPPGTAQWTRRSRKLQLDLVRLWGRYAGIDPALQG